MIPELEKPRATEIQVRMDCNGCVQKIKRALYGINGIYDYHIDFPQQKLTIIGWADPEKIVKAIKKTRKTATICSHTEQSDLPALPTEPTPYQPTEPLPPPPDGMNPPPPDGMNLPPPEAPPTEATPPAEPPKDPPPPTENYPLPQPPENYQLPPLPESYPPPPPPPESYPPPPPQPDVTPSTVANDTSGAHQAQPSRPKDVEEVHVIHHHSPDYGYRYGYGHSYGHGYGHSYGGPWNNNTSSQKFQQDPGFLREPSPQAYMTHNYNTYKPSPHVTHSYGFRQEPSPQAYVTHSYNTYKPSPHVNHSYNTSKPSPYVTEYEYIKSPPRYTHYSRPENYSDEYRNSSNGNGNITSIFSDENPNACRIA